MTPRHKDLASVLDRLADKLEHGARTEEQRYVFDPQGEVTLADVVQLLKLLNITAFTAEYLAMPQHMRAFFRPVDLPH